ncbi:histidine phosphatase family protein [Acidothermaceae bacterium B102]|nr:histidine phosphatase family protein [Acidothermaceae bacterium B102]
MTSELERTTVHLFRHGEVYNPDKVLYGRLPNFHLSEAGVAMAEAAARAVTGRDVVRVVASPLERAQETAKPIADVFGLEIHTDDRLIEAGNVFEGLTYGVGDGSMRRPTHWKHLRNPWKPSWGEPYQEIADRMLAAIHDARDAAAGHEAVLVSHQLPIWTVRRFVEGRTLAHRPDRRQCGLASLTSLEYEGDRLVSVSYTEPAGEASRVKAVPGA